MLLLVARLLVMRGAGEDEHRVPPLALAAETSMTPWARALVSLDVPLAEGQRRASPPST